MHLVVLGHPTQGSFSDALAHAYVRGLSQQGSSVETLALRDLQFDPHLRAGFSEAQPLEPDLVSAQSALQRAEHVAWFFPTWWAGPPALVKGFVDRAFLPGFAFKYRKGNGLPETLLSGRSSRVVTTMDSPSFWYNLWHRASVHAAFVNATLRYVGFGPISSTTVYKLRELSADERAAWVQKLEHIGRRDGARKARALPPKETPHIVPRQGKLGEHDDASVLVRGSMNQSNPSGIAAGSPRSRPTASSSSTK